MVLSEIVFKKTISAGCSLLSLSRQTHRQVIFETVRLGRGQRYYLHPATAFPFDDCAFLYAIRHQPSLLFWLRFSEDVLKAYAKHTASKVYTQKV